MMIEQTPDQLGRIGQAKGNDRCEGFEYGMFMWLEKARVIRVSLENVRLRSEK